MFLPPSGNIPCCDPPIPPTPFKILLKTTQQCYLREVRIHKMINAVVANVRLRFVNILFYYTYQTYFNVINVQSDLSLINMHSLQ